MSRTWKKGFGDLRDTISPRAYVSVDFIKKPPDLRQKVKDVDPRGLEPLTFPMPWERATNYAMGPRKVPYSTKNFFMLPLV